MRVRRTVAARRLGDGGCRCTVLAVQAQRAGSGAIHVLEAPGLARFALGSIGPRVSLVAGTIDLRHAAFPRKGVRRTVAARRLGDLADLCRVLALSAQGARR